MMSEREVPVQVVSLCDKLLAKVWKESASMVSSGSEERESLNKPLNTLTFPASNGSTSLDGQQI